MTHDDAQPAEPPALLAGVKRLGIEWVRRYHRLEIDTDVSAFDGPVLFVANHGFGGVLDLNVFAVYAAFESLALDRPVTALTHEIAWTLKVGRLLEPLGSRPASRASAVEAVRQGHHVLVMPGGDLDAFKTYRDRNRIVFEGRRGFARLAMDLEVPIVPLVTAGAGESLLTLSDGRRLAKLLRLDRTVRSKALPTTLSLPWGLNVGAVGLLPYFPLPTKLRTRMLAPMLPQEGECADAYGDRVEAAMQDALDELTRGRKPVIG
jgi:1-acyl-sn-glycerol-3-phosphate acyltransferase